MCQTTQAVTGSDEDVTRQDVTFARFQAPNTEAPKYLIQILTRLQGETASTAVTVRDFHKPLHQRTDEGRKSA